MITYLYTLLCNTLYLVLPTNEHPSKVVRPFLLAAGGYSALIALEAAALLLAVRWMENTFFPADH